MVSIGFGHFVSLKIKFYDKCQDLKFTKVRSNLLIISTNLFAKTNLIVRKVVVQISAVFDCIY